MHAEQWKKSQNLKDIIKQASEVHRIRRRWSDS